MRESLAAYSSAMAERAIRAAVIQDGVVPIRVRLRQDASRCITRKNSAAVVDRW